MKKIIVSTILLLLLPNLSGCMGAFLAGATTSGVVVSDNRDLKTTNFDNVTRHKLYLQMKEDPSFEGSNIAVSCFNRMILLTGQTLDPDLKVKADHIAKNMPNIIRVYNEIVIKKPIGIAKKTHDAWLTAKIKTKLLSTSGIKSGNIKVVTEDGSIYLLGVISEEQANIVIDIIRHTDGVKRVVNAFQLLRIINKSENNTE